MARSLPDASNSQKPGATQSLEPGRSARYPRLSCLAAITPGDPLISKARLVVWSKRRCSRRTVGLNQGISSKIVGVHPAPRAAEEGVAHPGKISGPYHIRQVALRAYTGLQVSDVNIAVNSSAPE